MRRKIAPNLSKFDTFWYILDPYHASLWWTSRQVGECLRTKIAPSWSKFLLPRAARKSERYPPPPLLICGRSAATTHSPDAINTSHAAQPVPSSLAEYENEQMSESHPAPDHDFNSASLAGHQKQTCDPCHKAADSIDLNCLLHMELGK